jgi:hypothetical protein
MTTPNIAMRQTHVQVPPKPSGQLEARIAYLEARLFAARNRCNDLMTLIEEAGLEAELEALDNS